MKLCSIIILTGLLFSCSQTTEKTSSICDCMVEYDINHTPEQLENTKACLENIPVSFDYDDPDNKTYIKTMDEAGDDFCPIGSRKFWHFLKTVNNV